jgi:hypothetical protein
VVAGGCAIAIAAAPAAAFVGIPTAAASNCPTGEIEDLYTDICVPEMSPNVAGRHWPTAGEGSPLPEVDGIPCTGANTGQCIGLEESQNVPHVEPHSSISSSP